MSRLVDVLVSTEEIRLICTECGAHQSERDVLDWAERLIAFQDRHFGCDPALRGELFV